jgi:hypothetical protein
VDDEKSRDKTRLITCWNNVFKGLFLLSFALVFLTLFSFPVLLHAKKIKLIFKQQKSTTGIINEANTVVKINVQN